MARVAGCAPSTSSEHSRGPSAAKPRRRRHALSAGARFGFAMGPQGLSQKPSDSPGTRAICKLSIVMACLTRWEAQGGGVGGERGCGFGMPDGGGRGTGPRRQGGSVCKRNSAIDSFPTKARELAAADDATLVERQQHRCWQALATIYRVLDQAGHFAGAPGCPRRQSRRQRVQPREVGAKSLPSRLQQQGPRVPCEHLS